METRLATVRTAQTIAGLLEPARSATSVPHAATTTYVAPALAEALQSFPTVVLEVGDDVAVALPEALLVRAVAPVVENAVRASASVTVSLAPAPPGLVAIAVDDHGPGISEAEQDWVFEAGHSVGGHGGSGLGLPLARRTARTAGGDVRLEPRDVGCRFVIELPRA